MLKHSNFPCTPHLYIQTQTIHTNNHIYIIYKYIHKIYCSIYLPTFVKSSNNLILNNHLDNLVYLISRLYNSAPPPPLPSSSNHHPLHFFFHISAHQPIYLARIIKRVEIQINTRTYTYIHTYLPISAPRIYCLGKTN